jgi:hypothetical protein
MLFAPIDCNLSQRLRVELIPLILNPAPSNRSLETAKGAGAMDGVQQLRANLFGFNFIRKVAHDPPIMNVEFRWESHKIFLPIDDSFDGLPLSLLPLRDVRHLVRTIVFGLTEEFLRNRLHLTDFAVEERECAVVELHLQPIDDFGQASGCGHASTIITAWISRIEIEHGASKLDMSTECCRIAGQLRRAFSGEAWHGPPLRDLVAGVTAIQAAARILPTAHTVWELVLHIDLWAGIAFRATRGDPMPKLYGTGQDWTTPLNGSEDEWSGAQGRLFETGERLARAIEAFDDARLNETVPGRDYDFYFLFHGVVQHSLYHAGQIAILKRALAAAH